MTRGRRVLGLLFAAAALVGMAWLSRVPLPGASPDEAVLRLSWRTLGVRVEECRQRTAEELAALAEHMRTPEVCVGDGADYELRVAVDGAEVVRDTLAPGGARRDRPVYVFRDLPLGPGEYRVEVDFRALVPPGYEPEGGEPPVHTWEGELRLQPGEIDLITLDGSATALVHREP